ncbi:MAG: peptidoglycan DD-metalloendopeptidase family protein [Bacteroidetes bacterium]|nr:peptidoglycan DD-metalloendopeptidase family protein [Bacteroidota bacterium]MCH8523582.1 peptidoglycan DD-metalloendopeptidase family protein [Balneolales bacterium]
MRILFAILAILIISPSAWGQDFERIREELRERQNQTSTQIQTLQQLILQYEQEIRESETEYESLYRAFQELEREIALRDAVIRNLQAQGRQLSEEINIIQREVAANRAELERLIATYQESLTYLYKHGRVPELAYLFTSGSFNQMLVRSYYLRRFEDQRTRQAEAIDRQQEELRVKEEQLVASREEVQRNLAETREAREGLQETRRRQDRNIVALQQNREQTQQKLAETRRSYENLNTILNNTIAELERVQREEEERIRQLEAERLRRLAEARQIQDAAEREREIARLSEPVTRSTAEPSREEYARIELSFVRSKGNLPWPVNGVVTQQFGFNVHPVYRTRIASPGIEISAEERSPVRVVHEGFVSAIYRGVGEFGDMVIVRHGDSHFTVYTNFSEISIRENTFVRAGDILGRSGSRSSPRGSSLYFIVRRSGADSNMNPLEWLGSPDRVAPPVSR